MSKKKDEKAPEENVYKVKGNAAFQDKDYPKVSIAPFFAAKFCFVSVD
jgi:hypothetical protein